MVPILAQPLPQWDQWTWLGPLHLAHHSDMSSPRTRIKDTDKTKNLEVAMTGAQSVDEMEAVLDEVASEIGLRISHTTTLGRKRYPGNRHWHLTARRRAAVSTSRTGPRGR